MKVLFLSSSSSSIHNAYHQRLRMLAAGLASVGVHTDFVYFKDRFLSKPALIHPLSYFSIPKILHDCDIIHGGDDAGTYAGLFFKYLLSKPIVYDIHGDAFQDELLYLSAQPWNPRRMFHVVQAKILETVASRIANGYIVVSEFQRKHLLSRGIPSSRIELIRNGVDTRMFRPLSTNPNPNFTFCYAGAMQEYQDINILFKAFHKLELKNIRLKIIGFTNRDKRLKKRITSVLKERVEILNKLPQKELINHLASADVLIIPRRDHPCMRYGFPVKFAEFASMGKPIIVSNVDETSDLVHRYHCGFVYEASNCESLLAKLKQVVEVNRQSLLEMGKNARRLAIDEFQWSRIARKYTIFLEQVVQNYKNLL